MQKFLQPLISLLLLYIHNTTAGIPECNRDLGTTIGSRDCRDALLKFPASALGSDVFDGERRFTTRYLFDPVHTMPQEADCGSCRLTIRIERGTSALISWSRIASHTHNLIDKCARERNGWGGKVSVDGKIVVSMSSTGWTLAGPVAAGKWERVATRFTADVLSLSPPARQDRAGITPQEIPVPTVPPAAYGAILHSVLERPAQGQGPSSPSGGVQHARPAALAAPLKCPMRSCSFAAAAMQQNVQVHTLQLAPAVGPAAVQQDPRGTSEPMATLSEPPKWGSRKPRTRYDIRRPAQDTS